MKFLVDAQLPARLARYLNDTGHNALHTSQLPDHNRTPDAEITRLADRDARVVVTKDRDFRDGHLLHRSPQFLLTVTTGNITNAALLALFEAHITQIVEAFNDANHIALTADSLVVHPPYSDGHTP